MEADASAFPKDLPLEADATSFFPPDLPPSRIDVLWVGEESVFLWSVLDVLRDTFALSAEGLGDDETIGPGPMVRPCRFPFSLSVSISTGVYRSKASWDTSSSSLPSLGSYGVIPLER